MNDKARTQIHPLITPERLQQFAVVYLRQSTPEQVQNNSGSAAYQKSLAAVARAHGWPDSQIKIIDEDAPFESRRSLPHIYQVDGIRTDNCLW